MIESVYDANEWWHVFSAFSVYFISISMLFCNEDLDSIEQANREYEDPNSIELTKREFETMFTVLDKLAGKFPDDGTFIK